MHECPLDVGGYFVINGSEKVLIAQEKMASNTVYVFKRKDPKYLFVSEIRSVLENSSRPARYISHALVLYLKGISTLLLKMMRGGASTSRTMGQTIQATVPYIRSDIPIVILFRALG